MAESSEAPTSHESHRKHQWKRTSPTAYFRRIASKPHRHCYMQRRHTATAHLDAWPRSDKHVWTSKSALASGCLLLGTRPFRQGNKCCHISVQIHDPSFVHHQARCDDTGCGGARAGLKAACDLHVLIGNNKAAQQDILSNGWERRSSKTRLATHDQHSDVV